MPAFVLIPFIQMAPMEPAAVIDVAAEIIGRSFRITKRPPVVWGDGVFRATSRVPVCVKKDQLSLRVIDQVIRIFSVRHEFIYKI